MREIILHRRFEEGTTRMKDLFEIWWKEHAEYIEPPNIIHSVDELPLGLAEGVIKDIARQTWQAAFKAGQHDRWPG